MTTEVDVDAGLASAAQRDRIVRRLKSPAASSRGAVVYYRGKPVPADQQLPATMPATLQPAAVLVPLIDHMQGLTLLLTERAGHLRRHAGQVSFPGGRIEAGDADAAGAALREAEEEIGLARSHVDVLGVLPDHLIFSGYRVTPVVGLVRPDFSLQIDSSEVSSVFELPLVYAIDRRNYVAQRRYHDGVPYDLLDLHYENRLIWGATAGIVLTLAQLLLGAEAQQT
ncbi:MAG: CoA pyrophosphatase [Steroidobacteraceae bacterium]